MRVRPHDRRSNVDYLALRSAGSTSAVRAHPGGAGPVRISPARPARRPTPSSWAGPPGLSSWPRRRTSRTRCNWWSTRPPACCCARRIGISGPWRNGWSSSSIRTSRRRRHRHVRLGGTDPPSSQRRAVARARHDALCAFVAVERRHLGLVLAGDLTDRGALALGHVDQGAADVVLIERSSAQSVPPATKGVYNQAKGLPGADDLYSRMYGALRPGDAGGGY